MTTRAALVVHRVPPDALVVTDGFLAGGMISTSPSPSAPESETVLAAVAGFSFQTR
jgi:hypothetical protein